MITILMSVYNGTTFLPKAIESILNQTFTNYIFLIIDDGSTDSTPSILNNYASQDHRIKIITNATNIGLTKSLNLGLDIAIGKYIARMDADEISLPDRLEKQFKFLENHPEIGICGTFYIINNITHKLPTDHEEIVCNLIWGNTLAHPTTMLRRSALESSSLRYDENYRYAQDYDFWFRCAPHTKLANLPEPLLIRREHLDQISTNSANEQSQSARIIRENIINTLGVKPSQEELNLHEKIATGQHECNKQYVRATSTWLSQLQQANKTTSIFPEPTFSKQLYYKWFSICRSASALGLWTLTEFRRNKLATIQSTDRRNLVFRCITRKGYWRPLITGFKFIS